MKSLATSDAIDDKSIVKTSASVELTQTRHSHSTFPPLPPPRGPLAPKRGQDTSGTRVRPHAKFGVFRPAGCREIVDEKANKNI